MTTNTAKILTFGILATLIISPSNADQKSSLRTGFYGGVAVGAAVLSGKKTNLFVNRLVGGVPTPQSFDIPTTDKNVAGDIFAGYDKKIDCFSLGIEAIGSVASLGSKENLNIINSGEQQTLEIKTTISGGGSFKIGYHLNPSSKLYIKLGIELGRFRVNFTDTFGTFANLNKSFNSTAFVPGFGLETDLTSCLFLRTEYRLALHPSKTVQVSGTPGQSTSVQTKPTIHFFMLGLAFKL